MTIIIVIHHLTSPTKHLKDPFILLFIILTVFVQPSVDKCSSKCFNNLAGHICRIAIV